MKEYRSSTKSKLSAALICALYVFAAFEYLYLNTIHKGKDVTIFYVIMFIVMTAIPSFILYTVLRWKLIITDNGIIKEKGFKRQEIAFEDIKGYRTYKETVTIEAKDEGIKPMMISKSFQNSDEFYEWLSNHYNIIEIPVSEEDQSKLKSAKIAAYTANAIGIGLMILVIVVQSTYPMAFLLCAFFPLLPYFIYRKYSGQITIAMFNSNPRPSIGLSFLSSSFGLVLAVFDCQYVNEQDLYLYSTISAFLFMLIFLRTNSERFKADKVAYVAAIGYLLAGGWMYGYGLISSINSQFDKSPVHIYSASVIDKYRVHGSKSTTNYIRLGPWGPVSTTSRISVRLNTYETAIKGENMTVKYRDGALGIGWYTLTQ